MQGKLKRLDSKSSVWLLVLSTVFWSAAIETQARTSLEGLQLWEKGVQEISRVAYKPALTYMNLAVSRDPEEALFWCSRAHVKIDLNDFRGAISDLDRAIELDPNMSGAYGRRGYCYCILKDYKRALVDLNKAIATGQIDVLRWNEHSNHANRAQLYKLTGRRAEALMDEIYVRNMSSLSVARSLRQDLQLKQAYEIISKAVQNEPQSVEAPYFRGIIALNSNREADALRDFNTVIRKRPSIIAAYYFRADAYIGLKKYQEAINDYSHIIEANPTVVVICDVAETGRNKGQKHFYDESLVSVGDIYYLRGTTYLRLKKHEEALKDLARAIAFDPRDVDAMTTRAGAFIENRQFQKAIEDCTKAIKISPKDLVAYEMRAKAYEYAGMKEKAVADTTKIIQFSRDMDDYVLRAGLFSRLKQWDRAIADYSLMLKKTPKDEAILLLRANCYMAAGKAQNAVDDLSTVITIEPRAMVYNMRAAAYEKLGRVDLAKRDKETAARFKDR